MVAGPRDKKGESRSGSRNGPSTGAALNSTRLGSGTMERRNEPVCRRASPMSQGVAGSSTALSSLEIGTSGKREKTTTEPQGACRRGEPKYRRSDSPKGGGFYAQLQDQGPLLKTRKNDEVKKRRSRTGEREKRTSARPREGGHPDRYWPQKTSKLVLVALPREEKSGTRSGAAEGTEKTDKGSGRRKVRWGDWRSFPKQ